METVISIATALVATIVFVVGATNVKRYVETVTVWDFQTGLHYRHGRYVGTIDAGKHRLWGRGHDVIFFDNRISEMVVQGQELITTDSATVKLTAVAQWKIVDALKFHTSANNAGQALYTLIQLALRDVFGALELDAVIEQKADFGKTLLGEVREAALAELGIDVSRVDVRDIMLGGKLKSVYAGVISARKTAQAQQERARGDAAALRTFANAARVFESNPELFRLRYLETLKEVGAGYGNQLIIGLPEELMGLVKKGE